MKRRQCKICNKNTSRYSGKVIKRKLTKGKLPGLLGSHNIYLYTIKCSKCGHIWQYRKKVK